MLADLKLLNELSSYIRKTFIIATSVRTISTINATSILSIAANMIIHNSCSSSYVCSACLVEFYCVTEHCRL